MGSNCMLYLNGRYYGTVETYRVDTVILTICRKVGDVVLVEDEDGFTDIYYYNSHGLQDLQQTDFDSLKHQRYVEMSQLDFECDMEGYLPYTDSRVHDHALRTTRSSVNEYLDVSRERGCETRSWAKRLGRRAERRLGKHLTRCERVAA